MNQLCRRGAQEIVEYNQFLRLYLEDIRGTSEAAGCKQVGFHLTLAPLQIALVQSKAMNGRVQ